MKLRPQLQQLSLEKTERLCKTPFFFWLLFTFTSNSIFSGACPSCLPFPSPRFLLSRYLKRKVVTIYKLSVVIVIWGPQMRSRLHSSRLWIHMDPHAVGLALKWALKYYPQLLAQGSNKPVEFPREWHYQNLLVHWLHRLERNNNISNKFDRVQRDNKHLNSTWKTSSSAEL